MFAEKRNAYGEVVKASTALSENKALSVTLFREVTYVHIADNKKRLIINTNTTSAITTINTDVTSAITTNAITTINTSATSAITTINASTNTCRS
ncbi:hypothetical protein DPMN_180395 [Dreissena polymorpha]|uniref:Uncharacterized protein n=1 Tax=Dreissena polymorpha TaxID=45954 RepID=A0A9D4EGK3_DREPO|nr:hypothetical protein DPMN_180395 [Dreissena polymorpha]